MARVATMVLACMILVSTMAVVSSFSVDVSNTTAAAPPLRSVASRTTTATTSTSTTTSTTTTTTTRRNLIFGGTDAAPNAYPFVAQQYWEGELVGCAGSLIASKWILTSAACVEALEQSGGISQGKLQWRVGMYCRGDDENANTNALTTNNNTNATTNDKNATEDPTNDIVDATANVTNTTTTNVTNTTTTTVAASAMRMDSNTTTTTNCGARETWVTATQIVIHPFWHRTVLGIWDFGLVELDRHVDEIPVTVDDGSAKLRRSSRIRNVGMGVVNNELQVPQYLQQATTQFLPTRTCLKRLPDSLGIKNNKHPSLLCTVGTEASTCRGDAGSPGMLATNKKRKSPTGWILVGVTSFGIRNACEAHEEPEGYAKTSAAYPWMVRNVCRSYASSEDNTFKPDFCSILQQLPTTEAPTASPPSLPEDDTIEDGLFLSMATRPPTTRPTTTPTAVPTSRPTNTNTTSTATCEQDRKTLYVPNLKNPSKTRKCKSLGRKKEAVQERFCVKRQNKSDAYTQCCETCAPLLGGGE